jgi:rhodanese-related sulfurtransferase
MDKTIALYCRSGRRSKTAAQLLAKQGYQIIELNTGFNSWKGEVEK